jgi:hypothetical protein
MDTTYHPNGGFKPAMKRFVDLDGPDFFPMSEWATYSLIANEAFIGRYGKARAATAQCRLCLLRLKVADRKFAITCIRDVQYGSSHLGSQPGTGVINIASAL